MPSDLIVASPPLIETESDDALAEFSENDTLTAELSSYDGSQSRLETDKS